MTIAWETNQEGPFHIWASRTHGNGIFRVRLFSWVPNTPIQFFHWQDSIDEPGNWFITVETAALRGNDVPVAKGNSHVFLVWRDSSGSP
jgi:hypothetical protein